MIRLHPLALRILGVLGTTSAAAILLAGGSAATSCCPPPDEGGPHTESLGPGCDVVVASTSLLLEQRCVVVSAETCPPYDDPSLPVAGASGERWACGPLPGSS